jgi:hypothetical protein
VYGEGTDLRLYGISFKRTYGGMGDNVIEK